MKRQLLRIKDTGGYVYYIDPDKVIGLMPYTETQGVLKKTEREGVLIITGFSDDSDHCSPVGIDVFGTYLEVARKLGMEIYEPGEEVRTYERQKGTNIK